MPPRKRPRIRHKLSIPSKADLAKQVPGGSWKAAMRVYLALYYAPKTAWLTRERDGLGVWAVVRSMNQLATKARTKPQYLRKIVDWLLAQGLIAKFNRAERNGRRWRILLLVPTSTSAPEAVPQARTPLDRIASEDGDA